MRLRLRRLVADACPRWLALADRIGGATILQHRGCLYLYETASAFKAAEADMAFRRTQGITVDLIAPDVLAGMEPGCLRLKAVLLFPRRCSCLIRGL